jgi:hypothetical protein
MPDIFLSENLGSAESKWRIDRVGFLPFFTRTETLLSEILVLVAVLRANGVRRPTGRRL